MGPPFSLLLMAIAATALFAVVFLPLKMVLSTADAARRAGAFVVGMGAGAASTVGLAALVIGTGTSLTTKIEVEMYLATIAIGALAGGAALSYGVARAFR